MEILCTLGPLHKKDPKELVRQPPHGATSWEIRADLLPPSYPVDELVKASPLPVVLTLRSQAEGGQGPNDPSQREPFYRQTARLGAAFYDLEAERDGELVGTVIPKEKVILSRHWERTPPDLEEHVARLLSFGTRYVKAVPTAHSLADVMAVLRLGQAFARGSNGSKRGILFAQGEVGVPTRLLMPFLAAPVAYACVDEESRVAPGQLTVPELLALVGHLQDRPRRVCGVIGAHAHRSLSPRMHSAAFRALGLPFAFVPLTVKTEEELVALLHPAGSGPLDGLGLPAGGFAITMPWKEKAALVCHVLAPRAQKARAVNTVLPRVGKLLGDLTDIDGLTRVLLNGGVHLAGSRVAVLGTGGAARAALVALELGGSSAVLVARDQRKGIALGREFGAQFAQPEGLGDVAAFINATPAGSDGSEDEMLARLVLPKGCVVVDMPYAATATYLQRLAQQRGWTYVSGKEVLLFQGVSQFAAMHGMAPPVRAMAEALGLGGEEG